MPVSKKAAARPPVRTQLAVAPRPATVRGSAAKRPKTDINELAPTQPLATVKARFSEFLDRVHRYRERIVVTKNGAPVAVIIHPDELFSIEETLDLMSDPEAMDALSEAKAGEPMTGDEFVARMERTFGPRPR